MVIKHCGKRAINAKDFAGSARRAMSAERNVPVYMSTVAKSSNAAIAAKDEQYPVTIAGRRHLYPSRTQKLSSPAPMILGGKLPGKVGRCRFIFYTGLCTQTRFWPHGQAVKTSPFHGGNPGSIPGGVTISLQRGIVDSFFFYNLRDWRNWQTH